MRMFLIFVLLIIPRLANANKTDCPTITIPDTCKNTAGCHFVNDTCKNCDKNNYCPGSNNLQSLCSSIADGNFNKSDEGAESKNDCYEKITCEDPWGNDITNSRHYYNNVYKYKDNNSWMLAHFESGAQKCYSNKRGCQLFDTSNCPSGTVGGVAVWYSDHWSLNDTAGSYIGCDCTNKDYSTDTCTGKASAKVSTEHVPNVSKTNPIEYNTIERYYCSSCNPGYYVKNIYTNNAISGCIAPSGSYVVCECQQIEMGWYGNGCTWNPNDLNNDVSTIHCKTPCPAGQTIDNPGASAQTACHYTNDTQFCDTMGCFDLSYFSDINLTDWQAQ